MMFFVLCPKNLTNVCKHIVLKVLHNLKHSVFLFSRILKCVSNFKHFFLQLSTEPEKDGSTVELYDFSGLLQT